MRRTTTPFLPWLAPLLLGLAVACASSGDGDGLVLGGSGPLVMLVDNQVQLLPACTDGHSLTFFEGYTRKDLPYGQVTPVTVAPLFGANQIGFQVNGWYWRCGGAASCPNPSGCQNPDNAGQVGIVLTPRSGAPGCASATLDTSWTLGLCDSSVPNARGVLTVTLVDAATCRVRIAAAGLDGIAPTAACCDCHTCGSAPGTQQTHCM